MHKLALSIIFISSFSILAGCSPDHGHSHDNGHNHDQSYTQETDAQKDQKTHKNSIK